MINSQNRVIIYTQYLYNIVVKWFKNLLVELKKKLIKMSSLNVFLYDLTIQIENDFFF